MPMNSMAPKKPPCSKKEAADMIAINVVLQNNAYVLLDKMTYQQDEEAIAAVETMFTASVVTCAYLMKEHNLTIEDVSNSLFELNQDMIKRMGSKEARRFSATLESTFIEFRKVINHYMKDMDRDLEYFREMELVMGKKNLEHI